MKKSSFKVAARAVNPAEGNAAQNFVASLIADSNSQVTKAINESLAEIGSDRKTFAVVSGGKVFLNLQGAQVKAIMSQFNLKHHEGNCLQYFINGNVADVTVISYKKGDKIVDIFGQPVLVTANNQKGAEVIGETKIATEPHAQIVAIEFGETPDLNATQLAMMLSDKKDANAKGYVSPFVFPISGGTAASGAIAKAKTNAQLLREELEAENAEADNTAEDIAGETVDGTAEVHAEETAEAGAEAGAEVETTKRGKK